MLTTKPVNVPAQPKRSAKTPARSVSTPHSNLLTLDRSKTTSAAASRKSPRSPQEFMSNFVGRAPPAKSATTAGGAAAGKSRKFAAAPAPSKGIKAMPIKRA